MKPPDHQDQQLPTKYAIDIKKQNQSDNTTTKSLKNLTVIFYQKKIDYDDYKLSLAYNHDKIEKIAFDSIPITNPKLISKLTKFNLTNLKELKFKDVALNDNYFELFYKNKGITHLFPNLKIFQVSGSQDLTTLFVTFCFVDPNHSINLSQLDLSQTKIDSYAIEHLSQFYFKNLTHLNFQWCSKIITLSGLSANYQNFPCLTSIDIRFTKITNKSVQQLIDTDFIFQLKQIRVFGSYVQYDDWDFTYLISCFIKQLNVMKKFNMLQFLYGNQLYQNQKIIMNSITSSNQDKNRINITCQIVLDLDQKLTFSVKWFVLDSQAMIQIVEMPVASRIQCLNFLNQYLSETQAIIDQLTSLQYNLEDFNNSDTSMIQLGDTIKKLKQIKQLNLRFRNLSIKRDSIFYLINCLKQSKQLKYLQLYLPNNNILLDKGFFEHIWKSLHNLEYLHLLYLNVFQNTVMDVRDIHDFLNSILFSNKGFYQLSNIMAFMTNSQNLQYELQDVSRLYLSDFQKKVNINMDQNLLKNSKLEKYFKIKMEKYRLNRRMLISQLYKAKEMKIDQKLRKEIINEIFDYHIKI